MPEILTESFCERCGTKYTLDSPEEKRGKGGSKRARVIARGLKNFVLSDDPLEDAFAAAEIEEGSAAASQQLEAFHELFNFCMECRQYTCANCWNQDEGRCLSCAPVVGRYDPLLSLTQDSTLPSLSAGLGMEPSPLQAAIDSRESNGHAPVDATAWPSADLPPTPAPVADAEIPDWLRPSEEEQAPQLAIEPGPADQPVAPEALAPEAIAPEPMALEPEPVEAIAPEPMLRAASTPSLEPFELLQPDAAGMEPAAAEWPEPLPLGVSEYEMPLAQPEPAAAVAAEAKVEEPASLLAAEPAAPEPHGGLFDRIMDRFGFPHPTEAGAAAAEDFHPAQAFEAVPEEAAAPIEAAIGEEGPMEAGIDEESPLEAAIRAQRERAMEAQAAVELEPAAMEAEVVVAEDEPLTYETQAIEPEVVVAEDEPLTYETQAIEPELVVAEDEPLTFQAEPIEAEPMALEPALDAVPWTIAAEEPAEPEPVWPPRAPVYQPPPAAMPSQPPAAPMPSTVLPPAAPMVPPAMAAQQVQQARAAAPIEPISASLVWEESARGVVSRAGTSAQGCVSCGLALSASARFCRRCGTRQG